MDFCCGCCGCCGCLLVDLLAAVVAPQQVERARLEAEYQAKLAAMQADMDRMREELTYRTMLMQVWNGVGRILSRGCGSECACCCQSQQLDRWTCGVRLFYTLDSLDGHQIEAWGVGSLRNLMISALLLWQVRFLQICWASWVRCPICQPTWG